MKNINNIEARTFPDKAHELTLPDGSVTVIPKAIRIRGGDGTVEREPRLAHAGKDNLILEGVIAILVSSEIKALAHLEDREVDLAVIRDNRLLGIANEQFQPMEVKAEEGSGRVFTIVARRFVEKQKT